MRLNMYVCIFRHVRNTPTCVPKRTRHSAKTFVLAYKLLSFSMQSVTVINCTLAGALSSLAHMLAGAAMT
jgi:hypothetical protein